MTDDPGDLQGTLSHEPTEGRRAAKAVALGAALGLILAFLARRRDLSR